MNFFHGEVLLDRHHDPWKGHTMVTVAAGARVRPTTNLVFNIGESRFEVPLCSKPLNLANIRMTQFWLPPNRLYGQRNQPGDIGKLVTDVFWTLCRAERAINDPGSRETYLLARLAPHVRAHGAKRFQRDSRPGWDYAQRAQVQATLNQLLKDQGPSRLTIREFRQKMVPMLAADTREGSFIRKGVLQKGAFPAYAELDEKIVKASNRLLRGEPDDAVQEFLHSWRDWEKRYGRRAHHEERKAAMDALSFECLAAMRRCWSALWIQMIAGLSRTNYLNRQGVAFHCLWHLDLRVGFDPELPKAADHLFQGHALGMHPAGSLLIGTEEGRQRLAAFVSEPKFATFEQVLAAYEFAVYCYQEYVKTLDDNRRERRRNDALRKHAKRIASR